MSAQETLRRNQFSAARHTLSIAHPFATRSPSDAVSRTRPRDLTAERPIAVRIAICLLALGSFAGGQPGKGEVTGPEKADPVRDSANRFALKLYARLLSPDRPNLLFSPLSIYTALSMTEAGARGPTAAEMVSVLEAPHSADDEHFHASYSKLLGRLTGHENTSSFRLEIADRLWLAQGVAQHEQFLHLLKTYYGAGVGSVDFRGQPEQARLEINKWVAQKTEDRIPELLVPGTISDQTVLVLTNAIFFKGQWSGPFDPKRTRPQAFHVSAKQAVEVPMMRRYGDYRLADKFKELRVLELEYTGSSASMIILLPTNGCELTQIDEMLSSQLDHWLKELAASKLAGWESSSHAFGSPRGAPWSSPSSQWDCSWLSAGRPIFRA